jgi:hypothetical protein
MLCLVFNKPKGGEDHKRWKKFTQSTHGAGVSLTPHDHK